MNENRQITTSTILPEPKITQKPCNDEDNNNNNNNNSKTNENDNSNYSETNDSVCSSKNNNISNNQNYNNDDNSDKNSNNSEDNTNDGTESIRYIILELTRRDHYNLIYFKNKALFAYHELPTTVTQKFNLPSVPDNRMEKGTKRQKC